MKELDNIAQSTCQVVHLAAVRHDWIDGWCWLRRHSSPTDKNHLRIWEKPGLAGERPRGHNQRPPGESLARRNWHLTARCS